MSTLRMLVRRNIRMFLHDKGLFFTSLITPAILLVLYISFLGGVFRDAFSTALPEGLEGVDRILDGLVGGQLISSILAVSCVTVAFCSGMLSVQDKASGVRRDMAVSAVSPHVLALSYYIANLLSTLLVCLSAMALCLLYLAAVGWYLSVFDVLLLLLDVLLLSLFGTALSSLVNLFLSTQGQISAVGTVVSSGYGFLAGAYMPISQFGEGLRTVIALLPGTHGTVLLRNHAMRGAMEALAEAGVPAEAIEIHKRSADLYLYLGDTRISTPVLYTVLIGAVLLIVGLYVLLHALRERRAAR